MFFWENTESQLGNSPSQVIFQVANSFFLPTMHNSSTMHNQTHGSIFHSHCSRPLREVVQVVHCTKAPAKRPNLCKAMSRHMFSYFAGKHSRDGRSQATEFRLHHLLSGILAKTSNWSPGSTGMIF